MTDFRETLRGITAMLLSCLTFVLHDTMVKLATDQMPIGQVLVLRAMITTAIVGFMVWRAGLLPRLPSFLSVHVASRSIAEAIAGVIFLTSLTHLPIATSASIAQGAPLTVTAASAIFLKEIVGWRRWVSILIGFVGILIIVRPVGDSFNVWALGPLATIFLVALREISTKFISKETPLLIVLFYTTFAVMIGCAILSAFEVWMPITASGALLLVGAGIFGLFGTHFAIVSIQHGDVSTVALFRYSFIIYAVVIGLVVWGEMPDAVTFLGMAIVIGSGVYTFYRERVRHQRIAAIAEPGV